MAQGRGSSAVVIVPMLLFLCVLVIHSEIVNATTFTVGDESGWTLNVSDWPNGKTFHTNDTLVFNYDSAMHNLVIVDEESYNSCKVKPGSKTSQSGHDEITLDSGKSFYLCSIPGHCEGGMKIAINAS